MERLDINKLLNREKQADTIKSFLKMFDENKNDKLFKKGVYVYGLPGTGKTTFVTNILKEMNYDVIHYDAGDIRNKNIICNITQNKMSDKNIMSIFHKKVKKIAIVMDEIDGMNNGDKGGINALISLVRPKKNKKQKLEETTMNPIICISNYHIDKKIKDLMKACNVVELSTPTFEQIKLIMNELMPEIEDKLKDEIIYFIQYDLKKLNTVYEIYKNNENILNYDVIRNIFHKKSYNDDTKQIVQKMMQNYYPIHQHLNVINDTDRTTIGLLWHENVIDSFQKLKPQEYIPFYLEQLDNICFSDYIDRITFQKQIWQFNEMSSLIKTFKNNKSYHDFFKDKQLYKPSEIRFTKVLTKYATEYNNNTFIQNICYQLGMDKKDLFAFFSEIKKKYDIDTSVTGIEKENNYKQLIKMFENYEIYKNDIERIFRYLDKNSKEETVIDKNEEGYDEIEEE